MFLAPGEQSQSARHAKCGDRTDPEIRLGREEAESNSGIIGDTRAAAGLRSGCIRRHYGLHDDGGQLDVVHKSNKDLLRPVIHEIRNGADVANGPEPPADTFIGRALRAHEARASGKSGY